MRLLITGSSGLLGLNLAEEARNLHEVIGADRGKLRAAPFRTINVDLLEADSVDRLLDAVGPEGVVNCAALADIDVCQQNPERAQLLNAELPRRLARACAARAIRLVHVSTDAVFDGAKAGFYTEQDSPNPIGIYSKTKLEGEQAVASEYPAALVARVNFYGWSLGGRRSLAEFFLNNLQNSKSMSGFTDVIFCPMLANQLARLLLSMLQQQLVGLYHCVGPQAMSKYQFGVEIARRFGLRESEISPKSILSSGLPTRRSHNLALSTHKLSTALGAALPSFSTGLDEFLSQYQQGYPQKLRSYQQAAVPS